MHEIENARKAAWIEKKYNAIVKHIGEVMSNRLEQYNKQESDLPYEKPFINVMIGTSLLEKKETEAANIIVMLKIIGKASDVIDLKTAAKLELSKISEKHSFWI